jgi:hypothetical protein
MMRIAHFINPVKVEEDSDFYKIQQKTFESLQIAQNYPSSDIEIDLFHVNFGEDDYIVPSGFIKLGQLRRSIGEVNPKLTTRKLPIFQDILEEVKIIANQYDLLIYTNMDIVVLPFFYEVIQQYHLQGHDAICVNRRRVTFNLLDDESLSNAYAELGRSHPGFDCFAFSPELLLKFDFKEICLGISFFEVAFVHQIAAYAKKPIWLLDKHLTIHFGLEVLVNRDNDYYRHNRFTYEQKIRPQIAPLFDLKHFPYGSFPKWRQFINWGLNPSIFLKEYIELSGKSWRKKLTEYLQEIRWRILQR